MSLILTAPARGHITQLFANVIAGIPHAGQDYAYYSNGEVCPEVFAAADGLVLFAGDARGLSWPNIMYLNPDFNRSDNVDESAGNYTIIAHFDAAGNRIALTGYGHQEAIWVKAGDRVKGRQQIGVIGETGNSRGKHLHFDLVLSPFDVDDAPFYGRVDPNPYFSNSLSNTGSEPTPLEEDDEMQTVFIDSGINDGKTYVGNALFHRHVRSPEELADMQLMSREGKLKLFADGVPQNQPIGCFGFNLDDFTAAAAALATVSQPFDYREPRTNKVVGTTTISSALGSSDLQFVATRDEEDK